MKGISGLLPSDAFFSALAQHFGTLTEGEMEKGKAEARGKGKAEGGRGKGKRGKGPQQPLAGHEQIKGEKQLRSSQCCFSRVCNFTVDAFFSALTQTFRHTDGRGKGKGGKGER